jgi:hypothetical protein
MNPCRPETLEIGLQGFRVGESRLQRDPRMVPARADLSSQRSSYTTRNRCRKVCVKGIARRLLQCAG